MQTQILTFNSENLKKCADEILSGGIVAFPTETVYGLGANALDENAVKKIYIAKGRPSDNPLICHVSDKAQIEKLGDVTPFARKIIDAFMPGPITVVLSKKNCVSGVVTGGLNTVGVRMPDHEVARTFIAECGVPLCAPSANTSTKPSPTQAKYVFDDLNGKIRYILDGGSCRVGIESTIVDCVNKRIFQSILSVFNIVIVIKNFINQLMNLVSGYIFTAAFRQCDHKVLLQFFQCFPLVYVNGNHCTTSAVDRDKALLSQK